MRTLRIAFTAVLCAVVLANATAASADPPADSSSSRFSIEALSKNEYPVLPKRLSADQGFQVMQLKGGAAALVDTSLVSVGIATAAKQGEVEISWVPQNNAQGYTVVRDMVKVAEVGPEVGY